MTLCSDPEAVTDGSAAVGNDEFQRRKVFEQVCGDQLHERCRIAVDVVRPGGVEIRVAGAAGGIRVEVAADEVQATNVNM